MSTGHFQQILDLNDIGLETDCSTVHRKPSVHHCAILSPHREWKQSFTQSTLRMQSIHWRFHGISIKHHQVLNWLLASTQNVYHILCQLTTEDRRNWSDLASQILQEFSKNFGPKCFVWEAKSFVLLCCQDSKHLEIL